MNNKLAHERSWYLLQTKTRQEKRARDNLERQSVEVFCPEILVKKIIHGNASQGLEILFPGYLFVKFKDSSFSIGSIRSTRGVQNFVSFGGSVAKVSSKLVNDLKTKLKNTKEISVSRLPKKGDKLQITEGPFQGLNAVFSQPNGDKRAMVLVNIMNQQIKASISYSNLLF